MVMNAATWRFIGLVFATGRHLTGPSLEKDEESDTDTDTDADSDADSDADGDADGDADSDADSDTDPVDIAAQEDDVALGLYTFDHSVYRSVEGSATLSPDRQTMSGEVWYYTEEDEAPLCNMRVSFSGSHDSEFTGACADCDFAFRLEEATLEVDDSAAACTPDPRWTFVEGGLLTDLGWGFQTEQYYAGTSSPYYREGVFQSIYSIDYSNLGGEIYGPYLQTMIWSGPYTTRGEATLSGDILSWTLDEPFTYYYYDYNVFANDCGSGDALAGLDHYTDSTVTGSLDCLGLLADTWSVEAESGQELSVSIDTIAVDSAFDPALLVNGPDDCTLIQVDDAFDCSFAPMSGRCPSAVVPVAVSGTYQIAVWGYGACTGDQADYTLGVRLQ